MAITPIKDILINARQESVQMRHHYLGVEHLVIAMLQIQGGITSSIVEDYGLTTEYVIDAIRRRTDKGTNQRLWAGFPYTPRTEVILDIANDLAAENGSEEISERELLVAILTESDSLPVRVFQALGVNIRAMILAAAGYNLKRDPQPPDISVIFAEAFAKEAVQRDHLFVLRRMFAAHNTLRVENQLTGYSGALVLVVTPIHADGQEDAPVVVKIHETDKIFDEVHRYETHVKSILPLQTARLEDNPIAPDTSELAGIKYSLVANSGGIPLDLRQIIQTNGAYELGILLQSELYTRFKVTWWQQKRPFRFQAWKEYDWVLPPLMTLDYIPEADFIDVPLNLKVPINRAKLKNKLQELTFGNEIVLENFAVQKIERQKNILKLTVGFGSEADKRACQIEVRGVNDIQQSFYRGEIVEKLTGTIWKTRNDHLLDALRDLEPDFDLSGRWIMIGDQQFPNPLLAYDDLLDRYVSGSMSKIHGDLHLGNILVGPNNSIWLIDFGSTRDGHTLFDWATLEMSLLSDGLTDKESEDWNSLRNVTKIIIALNDNNTISTVSDRMFATVASVAHIREIVRDCLAVEGNWAEYFVALAFCGLRAISWKTMSVAGRRLAFLVSAMAIFELSRHSSNLSISETATHDHTDIIEHLPASIPSLDQKDE